MIDKISHLIEPKNLEAFIGRDDIVIIDLCNPMLYQKRHVPGAIYLNRSNLISNTPPATGKHPSFTEIKHLVEQLGISNNKHTVIYDDEGGGWAGSLAWILDLIGVSSWSYLNGGIVAWINEGHPTEDIANQPTPREVDIGNDFLNPNVVISMDQILDNLGSGIFTIWDARSSQEFSGERIISARGGHIPGAINLEWTELIDQNKNLRIRDDAQQILDNVGLSCSKTIITHCQTHHRSSFTYMVARILGYESIIGYDGSWSEWGNLDHTPVEFGL